MTEFSACDFCTISIDQPHRIILEGPLATSFLSDPRMNEGHALVIPNRHVELPQQLTAAEIVATHREADRLTQIMLRCGSLAMGVDRFQKARPDMPETRIKRNHAHTHILPSRPGQLLYSRGIYWGSEESWRGLDDNEREAWLHVLRER